MKRTSAGKQRKFLAARILCSLLLGMYLVSGYNLPVARGEGVAIGNGATASHDTSTAVGNNAKATGENSTAVGNGAIAQGDSAVAAGADATANGENTMVIGKGAIAEGKAGVAMGNGASAEVIFPSRPVRGHPHQAFRPWRSDMAQRPKVIFLWR